MSAPFDDDTLSTGEPASQELVFSGWDEADRLYLELDFAPADAAEDDEELP